MSPKTLKEIKQEISKFYKLYETLVLHWNGDLSHGQQATYPETVLISVLLQNMQFSGVGCAGYDHDTEYTKLMNAYKALREINDYHNKCYMTHYAFNEVDCIITGYVMAEESEY